MVLLTPLAVGSYRLTRDGAPMSADAGTNPPGTPISTSVSGPLSLILGATARYSAMVSGGVPPYFYNWSVNSTQSRSANGPNLTYLPVSDGFDFVNLTVTDANGSVGATFVLLEVTGPGPLTVSIVSARPDIQGRVTLTASVLGGTPPYSYRWTGPGSNGSWSASSNWTSAPLATGTYPVNVSVRDQNGFHRSASVTIRSEVNRPAPSFPWSLVAELLIGAAIGATAGILIVRKGRSRSNPRGSDKLATTGSTPGDQAPAGSPR